MTEEQTPRNETIEAVVDRVSSYQDGAPEGTVEQELRRGFDGAGVEVSDHQVATLTEAIERRGGEVNVEDVLGA